MKLKQSVALIICAVMLSGMMPGNVFYVSAEGNPPASESAVLTEEAVQIASEPTAAPMTEPTAVLTAEPTAVPTEEPTPVPTAIPAPEPTEVPTPVPTAIPAPDPTEVPTPEPTAVPTIEPTVEPTPVPSIEPTTVPTQEPTAVPTSEPTAVPTPEPTVVPTAEPTITPTPEHLFSEGYALVKLNNVPVHARAGSGSRVVTMLSGDDSVFVSERRGADEALPDKDWLFIHFNTSEGPAEGFIRAEYLEPCTQAETDALISAIRGSGSSVSFSGHPLMLLDCELIPETTPEPTPEPATEPTPEPLPDSTPEPTPEVSLEPTVEQSPPPIEEPALEPTSEPTQEPAPVESPMPAPEEAEPQGSVSISIDPLFAAPGDTVTLTATVIGYEGASFQWQWSEIPIPVVEEIAETAKSEPEESTSLAKKTTVSGAAADELVWHDEPDAKGLVYQFTATPGNLNRFWRLVITIAGALDESGKESARFSLSAILGFLLFTDAHAEGGAVIVTDGFASLMSALEAGIETDPIPKGLLYSITNGKATITGYTGTATVLNIPFTVESVPVRNIGVDAFYDNSIIQEVFIPSGVTSIGNDAFHNCINLTSVSIPIGMKAIGDYAFMNCSNLTSVSIPEGIYVIKDGTFSGCSKLKSVSIPSSVVSIRENAFSYCSSLVSAILPSGVAFIGVGAFFQCSSLMLGSLPSSLSFISEWAFAYCESLESISIPSGVYGIDLYAFLGCSNLNSVVIQEGANNIEGRVFAYCDNLQSITIPNSVTYIKDSTFENSPVTISGYLGSYAQSYADRLDIPFEALSVEHMITSINFIDSPYTCSVREGVVLSPEILPDYASYKRLRWSSSDTSVARVDSNGKVVIWNPGYATITATAQDGSGESASCVVKAIKIELDTTSVKLNKGASKRLTATILPETPNGTTLNWSSSIDAVATVDSDGLVTAVSDGTATITAMVNEGSGISASCAVTVWDEVTGIILDSSSITLETGMSHQLTAVVLPANASDKSIAWSYSKPLIAFVGFTGFVNAFSPGTTTVTATAKDGSGISASCNITVIQKVNNIQLEPTTATVDTGSTVQITAVIYPNNASDKNVDWTSSNPSIATVDANGLVNTIIPGTVIIKAVAHDGSGVSTECEITVQKRTYDMSKVIWDYTAPFTYNDAIRTIHLINLPEGIEPIYSGNSATNPGTYTASAAFTYDTPNYNTPVIAPLTWKIDKLPGTISSISDISKVYDGSPVSDPAFTVLGDGAVSVAYYAGISTGGDLSAEPLASAPVNAGSYTVEITAAEGTNYLPAVASRAFTISKAAYDMSDAKWNYTGAFTYDGAVKTVLVTGLPAGVTIASYSGNTATNTGTYTASATFDYDMQNYEVPTIAPLTWTISKAAYDMSGAKWDYTSALPYDGTVKTVLVTGLPAGVTVASYSGNTATNTGTYTASATLNYDTQNYEVPTIASLTWTISKATYDMSAAKWDYTSAFSYNGTEKAVQVIGLPDGVSVASYSDSSKVNAGVYTASAILSYDKENYIKPEIADLTWEIQKAPGSVSGISDISKEYDGSPASDPSFTKSGDGAVSVSYYAGTSAGGDLSAEPLSGAPVNAGSYTVMVSIAEGTNHLPATASRAFTISKAAYDMSGAKWNYPDAFTYDGTEKTVQVIGLPNGVSVTSYTENKATNPGTYTASAAFTYDAQNYYAPVIAPLTWEIIDPIIRGDANGDGAVDIMDLVAIIDYIVGSSQVDSAVNADANGDGAIDIMDLVWIIDCIVGA